MKYSIVIHAYEVETPQGQFLDSARISLVDTNCDSALERAKKIIKKKFYRVSEVVEILDDDK